MSPAGAAVLRQVLVADGGQEVSSVEVLPFPGFGEVVGGHKGVSDARCGSVGVSNTAGGSDLVVFASEGNAD